MVYRNILIATDGSDIAERAVKQGIGLAKSLGAKLTAVTVTDHFSTTNVMMPHADDVDRYEKGIGAAAKKILDSVAAQAREQGVTCDTRHVADEYPAAGIIAAARDAGCDLIVVATHGRRGLDRLLLGSQATKVLALSTVPVLICR